MAPVLQMKHSMLPGLGYTQKGPKRDKSFVLRMEEESKNKVKVLGSNQRDWQLDAFKALRDERFAFCTAFCGSGKSILQVYLAAHDYVRSGFVQKQLLIVPQSVIANGFANDGANGYIEIKLNRKHYTWRVQHNFCVESSDVLNKLEKWLLSPVRKNDQRLGADGHLTGGIAIATHAALSLVWNRLKPSQRKRAIHNLTLRVDEAHHIKGVFDQDADDYTTEQKLLLEEESTHLGDICRETLNSSDETAKLHLTTATPYRGDRGIILSTEAKARFSQYFLPWLKHWETLGIEGFSILYEEYSKTPFDLVIDRIKAESKERHMIIVPAMGNKWRKKDTDYKTFLRKLYKVVPQAEVLDLVTPSLQKRNKDLLNKEPKSHLDGESKYRVVLTCMIGREGMDWVPCSRLHNTSVERSLTLAVQTTGRPLRKYLPKKEVRVYNYVEAFGKGLSEEKKRQLFSDRSNGVLVGMQWDDLTDTILIPEIPSKGASRRTRLVTLAEVFGENFQAVRQALHEEISSLEELNHAALDSVCEAVIEEFPPKLHVDHDTLVERTRQMVLRQIVRSQPEKVQERMRLHGIDITFLREEGFDKVIRECGIDNRAWFRGEHGTEDWVKINGILRNQVMSFEQQRREVEAYLKRTGRTA